MLDNHKLVNPIAMVQSMKEAREAREAREAQEVSEVEEEEPASSHSRDNSSKKCVDFFYTLMIPEAVFVNNVAIILTSPLTLFTRYLFEKQFIINANLIIGYGSIFFIILKHAIKYAVR